MNKKMGLGLAILCSLTMTGCTIGNTAYKLDISHVDSHSVFEINTEECGVEEAKLYLCNYKNLYGTAYGVDLWEYDFKDASLADYVKAVTLSELTRIYCMDLLAEEHEMTLDSEEEALCKEAAKQYWDSLTEDEKSYMNVSTTKLTEYYEHYALAEKLYKTMTEGVNEEVSDDEARVIRIQQIVVSSEETANLVAEKLSAGEDFATVASSYNQADSVELTAARGDLPEAVEDVAFDMENDEVSSEIVVENQYYFIHCISKYEEELTEENKNAILVRREKEQFNDVYDAYLDSATKGLNEDLWSGIEIDLDLDISTDSFFAVYDEIFATE